ncbi:uncharacterized protein FSUBG_13342 [Fusarium subglutinans]|uniref:Uncharacterized protein n=1 Tax=Gibberella subglutinans TaxID=42677 RepID=A0A8H5KXP8_GIBSU|nr:uncharacterized protein FSUBG_13342 [Fusarium subglutinans]KAF5580646.1 hypothetical protein FSUBG_13342 [Fusarium subglutinans]
MEQDQIGRHQSYPLLASILPDGKDVARPSPPTPPLQDYDFPNHTNETVYEMDAPIPRGFNTLRYKLLPPPAASDASTSVSEDLFSDAESNFGSWSQSLISSSTGFDEEHPPIRPPCLISKRATSPLSSSSESDSESSSCSLSSEDSEVLHLSEPSFTYASTEKEISGSIISPEIKSNALDRFEKQRLAIETTHLPNPGGRTHCWLMPLQILDMSTHGLYEACPYHHAEEEYPATEAMWKDTSTSYAERRPIPAKGDTQKSLKRQKRYISMDIEPYNFGRSKATVASLPEYIRTMIMSFCTEPKDLIALINSSSVFLQPFCRSRRAIVSQITQSMRLRFGGDMPSSCLMVARLRNMESRSDAGSPEAHKANVKRTIKKFLTLTPKGPLLHPSYSLRQLRFVSETLETAESVMTCYAHQAWISRNGMGKLGPSHTVEDLVLFKTERKGFIDAICLYDAYCTAFFSENAISSVGDITLRQSFLEEDGIPGEIINRFYSISNYLHQSYFNWIHIAINEARYDPAAKDENLRLIPLLEKHIGLLVNHFVCSGPSIFRSLQEMRATPRSRFLLRLLERCETDAAYRQKITSPQGREGNRLWAYREIASGLTTEEVQTAQHFWDPAIVRSMKVAPSVCSTVGLPLRHRRAT